MISAALVSGICIAGAYGRSLESPLRAGRAQAQAGTTVDPSRREAAYRESNLGVAYLEQFRQEDAVKAFRRALELDPTLRFGQINLSIALFYSKDLTGAAVAARAAAAADPNAAQPAYLLGLIARAENRSKDAITHFTRVLELDANDLGTRVNLGQVYLEQQRFADAVALFRGAVASEPYNLTASYGLGMALTRNGQAEDGRRALARFQSLREAGYATSFSSNYLEQGRYAEAVVSTGAEAELVDQRTPPVRLTREPLIDHPAGGNTADGPARLLLADIDGDGHLDLVETSAAGLRLFHNDDGKMRDVTSEEGLAGACDGGAVGAIAGDYDNDGRPDLLVLCQSGMRLFRQASPGRFTNASATPGFPAAFRGAAAALVDLDHDGDLDAVVADSGGHVLVLRNNGNLTFTDISEQAGISSTAAVSGIVPTDVDNHRDVDVVIAGARGLSVFLNHRDGTFADAASTLGLANPGPVSTIAVGDVNKDGFPDFFFGRADGEGAFALSDGRGQYTVRPAPASTRSAVAAQFVDYDNDGLLDLAVLGSSGVTLLRNAGGAWIDVSATAIPAEWRSGPPATRVTALAVGDIDGDGDDDLVVREAGGGLSVGRSNAASVHGAVSVRLTGRVSNRGGVGSKIEIRAGSLRQKLESYATTPPVAPADALFGLGAHRADVVRVLWPSGILQAEAVDTKPGRTGPIVLALTELDRKPSSCPFLYAWNGTRFAFVTDFLGGGEMGYWEAPGVRNVPDPNEYVRISSDQLRPKDGRLELRVTNELEEALYLDHAELIAIAHPEGTRVYPNEGMRSSRASPVVFVAPDPRPPRRATDDQGHDVLGTLTQLDRRYVDTFALERVRGYAAPHTLTLDLGDTSAVRGGGRLLLLLTGWTDYAFSSDNVAAYQAGLTLKPPALEVKDASGAWVTAVPDVGIPVGRPQTIVLDLTGKLPSASHEIRIVTNMRVYWDQVLVDASGQARAVDLGGLERHRPLPATALSAVRLGLSDARLRWRGFSAEVLPQGRPPVSYDYQSVSTESPWKVMPGRYTREGDVLELLAAQDDRFVVSEPGDEVTLSFDARALTPIAAGWTHTYLLFAQGYSKEMDVNSASPDTVDPLPFAGMPKYPYGQADGAAAGRRRRDYVERFNTRIVHAQPFPSLDLWRPR
jgi:Flp pilus assembly protein TadD